MDVQITKKQRSIGNKNKGFTLVELIIVITILAILATIAFVSFKSYTGNARDGNRMTALSNIQKGLEIYQVKVGNYPQPDDITGVGMYQSDTLNYVGKIGDTISRSINMNKTPIDPQTQDKYVYGVSSNYQKYQLATTLEELEAGILVPTTYAAASKAKVVGNYKYPLKLGNKVYSLPSLIFVGNGDLINNSTGFIINNGQNLPYSLDGKNSNSVGVTEQLKEITGQESLTLTGINIGGYTSIETVTGSTAEEIAANLGITVSDLGTILFPKPGATNITGFTVKFDNEDYKGSETTASWLGGHLSGSLMNTALLKTISPSEGIGAPINSDTLISYNGKILFLSYQSSTWEIYEYDGVNTTKLNYSSAISPSSVSYLGMLADTYNNTVIFQVSISDGSRKIMAYNGTNFQVLSIPGNRNVAMKVVNNKLLYRNDDDSLTLYVYDGTSGAQLSSNRFGDNTNPFYFCHGKYYFKLNGALGQNSSGLYSYDGTSLVNVSGSIDMGQTYDIRGVCEGNVLYFDTYNVATTSNLRNVSGHSSLGGNPRTMKLNTDTNVIQLYSPKTWMVEQRGEFNTVKYNNNYYSSQDFGEKLFKYDTTGQIEEQINLPNISRISSLTTYKGDLYFLANDSEDTAGFFKLNGNQATKVCNFVPSGNDALAGGGGARPQEYQGVLYLKGQKLYAFNGTDCFKASDVAPLSFVAKNNKIYFSNYVNLKHSVQEFTGMGDVMTYIPTSNILVTKDIASGAAFSGKTLSISATIPEGTSYSAQFSANKSIWTNIATNFTGSLNTTKLQGAGTELYIRLTLNGTSTTTPVINSLNLE